MRNRGRFIYTQARGFFDKSSEEICDSGESTFRLRAVNDKSLSLKDEGCELLGVKMAHVMMRQQWTLMLIDVATK